MYMQLDLRQAVVEAWAELLTAAPEDREAAKERYHILLEEFTEGALGERLEV
jgi:hypothetical protein